MWLGLLVLFIANFLGGAFTPLFIKLGIRELPPITFTLLRFIVASFVLLPLYARNREKLSKNDYSKVFFFSIFFALNVGFYGVGLKYTTAIVSQVLYTLVPLFVGVLAYFLLKERFSIFKIVGAIIAFIGVITLILGSNNTAMLSSLGSPLGNLLVLSAVISWSIYIVLSRKLTQKYHPLTITFYSFVTTIVLLLPVSLIELYSQPVGKHPISQLTILSIFGAGILGSAIMFFLTQIGIKKTSAYTASLFSYFAPLINSLTSIPLLHEEVTTKLLSGGILIIAGVFIATTLEHILKTGKILK